jgi:hypothetical protein
MIQAVAPFHIGVLRRHTLDLLEFFWLKTNANANAHLVVGRNRLAGGVPPCRCKVSRATLLNRSKKPKRHKDLESHFEKVL